MRKWISYFFFWLIAFGISILLRTDYFLGNHFFFDGDEAIIGIMAENLLHGKDFPIFFYGQRYGFSLLEVFSTALFLWITKSKIWALKLGALWIYSASVLPLLFYFENKNCNWFVKCLSVFVLLAFPPWILWSCMCRGGYVTAFFLVFFLWSLLQKKDFTKWTFCFVGILFSFLFFAQAQFFLILLPLLIYKLFEHFKREQLGVFIIAFMVTSTCLYWFSLTNNAYWVVPKSDFPKFEYTSLFFTNFTSIFWGYHYFQFNFEVPIILKYTTYLLLPCIVFVFYFAFKSDKKEVILLAIGGLISCCSMLFMDNFSARYFLPFWCIFYLFFIIRITTIKTKFYQIGVAIFSLILLVPSLFYLHQILAKDVCSAQSDLLLFEDLLTQLEAEKVTHFVTYDPMLNWSVNYYADGKIKSRYKTSTDRIPHLTEKVTNYFKNKENEICFVGYNRDSVWLSNAATWFQKTIKLNERYFLCKKMRKADLEEIGFQF